MPGTRTDPAKAITKYINNCQRISMLYQAAIARRTLSFAAILSPFSFYFVYNGTTRIQSICLYFACRNYVSPIKKWWSCGVPPPSPKRLFRNEFRIITIFSMAVYIINIPTGNCKFLSYNDNQRLKNEVFR